MGTEDPVQLDLNCLVLGDGRNSIFPVQIPDGAKVSHLKVAIMDVKKHTFPRLDADALTLFKVSLPDEDDLPAKLENFRPRDDHDNGVLYLSPTKRLKPLFEDIVDGHVHVLVLAPTSIGELSVIFNFTVFMSAAGQISRNHTVSVSPDPNDFESQLRMFCKKYWGTGEEGRKAIRKEIEVNIPPCFELQESGQSDGLAVGEPPSDDDDDGATDDDGMESSPSADIPTIFNTISFEPELGGFFGVELECLLIRKEYLSLKEHLEGLYADNERGVIVLGQPGIGKSFRRIS
jgi:hypothetical protein